MAKPIVVPVLLLSVMMLSALPAVSADPSAGGIVVTSLDYTNESFTLGNTSDTQKDIGCYTVTDGEGTVVLPQYVLGPGCRVTFASKPAEGDPDGTIQYPSEGKKGNLTFANGGDELLVRDADGRLVDSVCYGTSKGVEGWIGDPVPAGTGKFLQRYSDTDTDTKDDWELTKSGWTDLSSDLPVYEAVVTPFTFPESEGIPVLRALDAARSEVCVCIYLLSDRTACQELAHLAQKGVKVKVLFEGSPLGVNTNSELRMMKALEDAGAEVRIINGETHARYSYVHAKYAVIDGTATVVTSENWTEGNIGTGGNRGWGAVIESADLAGYYMKVFENDFDTRYGDVAPLDTAYPTIDPLELEYSEPGAYPAASYTATVSPVFSPDNSYDSLRSFISSAGERLYVEQMDLASDLSSSTGDTPIAWMQERALQGADTRFILDASTSDGSSNRQAVELLNVTTMIDAVAVDGREGFSLIHNKGVIQDDAVWVGSVNWTRNSFGNNRESAVIIRSAEVQDYFAGYFLEDFGVTEEVAIQEGLSFTASLEDTPAGTVLVMAARGPEGCTYVWDAGDGRSAATDTGRMAFRAPGKGTFTASVTVPELGIRETFEYHVDGKEGIGTEYILAGAAILAGLAVAAVRTWGNRKVAGAREHGNPYDARRRCAPCPRPDDVQP